MRKARRAIGPGIHNSQNGFIPMLICLALLIMAVIYVSYRAVAQAQH